MRVEAALTELICQLIEFPNRPYEIDNDRLAMLS